MLGFFKKLFTPYRSAEYVPDTHIKFTYAQIRDVAIPAPAPEDLPANVLLRQTMTVKGEAYHAWIAVASAIGETRCQPREQGDLYAAQAAVKQIASLIEVSPSPQSVMFERERLATLFRKTIFLQEMAKIQAEKGSKGTLPYVVQPLAAPNATPLFADKTKSALRASGRINAQILTRFAENIDALAGIVREPAANAPGQDNHDNATHLRWGP
ncbi:MAG TPA: hypothetical protein VFS88_09565 [Micavibrio sp.]|nr:hypothetical protein [Micavibrio sp.]